MKFNPIVSSLVVVAAMTAPAVTFGAAADLNSCCTPADKDQPKVGGNLGNQSYSSLSQITKANLAKLGPVWTTSVSAAAATTPSAQPGVPQTGQQTTQQYVMRPSTYCYASAVAVPDGRERRGEALGIEVAGDEGSVLRHAPRHGGRRGEAVAGQVERVHAEAVTEHVGDGGHQGRRGSPSVQRQQRRGGARAGDDGVEAVEREREGAGDHRIGQHARGDGFWEERGGGSGHRGGKTPQQGAAETGRAPPEAAETRVKSGVQTADVYTGNTARKRPVPACTSLPRKRLIHERAPVDPLPPRSGPCQRPPHEAVYQEARPACGVSSLSACFRRL